MGQSISGEVSRRLQNLEVDVVEAINRLDARHQQILDMIVLNGIAYSDAAETLGLSAKEVRTRLVAAKTALGKSLNAGANHPAVAGSPDEEANS